jgi:hypothetical protein
MDEKELRAALKEAARLDQNAKVREIVLQLRAAGWEKSDEFYWIH